VLFLSAANVNKSAAQYKAQAKVEKELTPPRRSEGSAPRDSAHDAQYLTEVAPMRNYQASQPPIVDAAGWSICCLLSLLTLLRLQK